ncbi:MAG: WxL protein peptidoglycan domain-containing protein [Desertimonas sp.]
MPTTRLRWALVGAVAWSLLGLTAPAYAQDEEPPGAAISWGVQPSTGTGPSNRASFEYDLAPGESTEDWVGVTNHGDEPITLRLYASDAFTTTSGGFDLLPSTDVPVDVGSWIVLEQSDVVLQPGERADVAFTLTVPANATPGDHPGGIVASFLSEGDGAVLVDQRVGSRVYLRVDGELAPALVVEDFAVEASGGLWPWDDRVTVGYVVRNTGNVRLSGGQVVEVQGVAGLDGSRVRLGALPELLPGAEVDQSVTIEGVWQTGRTRADLTIEPLAVGVETEPIAHVEASAAATSIPWTLLVVIVVTMVALVLRRVRRRSRAASGVVTDPTGEKPGSGTDQVLVSVGTAADEVARDGERARTVTDDPERGPGGAADAQGAAP